MKLVDLLPNKDHPKKRRLSPYETTEDIRRCLKTTFENNYNNLWAKAPDKEKRKKDLTQLNARTHRNAVKETETI